MGVHVAAEASFTSVAKSMSPVLQYEASILDDRYFLLDNFEIMPMMQQAFSAPRNWPFLARRRQICNLLHT